jgi:uncharacterized protein YndB with AHSA1/START domain
VRQYRFLTTWLLEAAREQVWDVIYDAARWPQWWRGVERCVVERPGNERGEGALWRAAWRSVLPYTLEFEFELEHVERPSILVGRARGDLEGSGTWRLYEGEAGTASTWEWVVRTTQPWMNAFGPSARPVFAWNHHRIMRRGAEGVARRLGCRLVAAT